MKDVMVDLETLGMVPGCVIISIGAVFFDSTGLGDEFYTVVNRMDAEARGLTVDAATVKWWTQQSDEARKVLHDSSRKKTSLPLMMALAQFDRFLSSRGDVTNVRVWGNGADFDNPILAVAYDRLGQRPPWKFWNNRCFRTLKNLAPEEAKPPRQGTHHNALDDAKHQAEHAVRALRWLARR